MAIIRDGKESVGINIAPHTIIMSHGFIDGSRSHDYRTIHSTISNVEVLEIDVLDRNRLCILLIPVKRGETIQINISKKCVRLKSLLSCVLITVLGGSKHAWNNVRILGKEHSNAICLLYPSFAFPISSSLMNLAMLMTDFFLSSSFWSGLLALLVMVVARSFVLDVVQMEM